MNQTFYSFAIAGTLLSSLVLAQPSLGATPLILHYSEPAMEWEMEALPIGNGQMGAML
jgi:hypothetical protein